MPRAHRCDSARIFCTAGLRPAFLNLLVKLSQQNAKVKGAGQRPAVRKPKLCEHSGEWHDRAKFNRRTRHVEDPALVRGAVPLLKTFSPHSSLITAIP
jgi:hypothetical protein